MTITRQDLEDAAKVAGMVCSVDFALGRADVRLLPWSHDYRGGLDSCGGVVWHVEDVRTGHRDFVGAEWLVAH